MIVIAATGGITTVSSFFIAFIILVAASLAITAPYIWTIHLRWKLSNTHFGAVGLTSSLPGGTIYWLFVKAFGCTLLLSFFFFILAAIGGGLISISSSGVNQSTQLVTGFIGGAIMIVSFVTYFLLFVIIGRYFFHRGLWCEIASSITLTNVEALDAAKAQGYAADRFGAGLADALDVAGAF